MQRTYAGILGLLAFLTIIVRGWFEGRGVDGTLMLAWWCLLLFTAVGWLIGWLAARTVDESVHAYVTARIEAEETKPAPKIAPTAPPQSPLEQ